MEMPLYNQEAEKVGTVKLNDSVFAVPMNRDLLYQVVTAQTSNRRQTIAHAKGRSEVSGGGKKPWQQKGTGRARHGSIRSPIWKGGGVAHGPTKDRNFKKNINQAAAHKALAVALSAKVRDGQVLIVDSIVPSEKKTKAVNTIFNKVVSVFASTTKRKPSVLFVLPANEPQELFRLSKNLPTISAQEARNLNSLDVLSSKYLVFLKDAVGDLEKLVK